MKKFRLNIEDLKIESFASTTEAQPSRGTVNAAQEATGPLPGCSTYGCASGSDEDTDYGCTGMTGCGQNTCYPICELED
jgi:hypothetical protein